MACDGRALQVKEERHLAASIAHSDERHLGDGFIRYVADSMRLVGEE